MSERKSGKKVDLQAAIDTFSTTAIEPEDFEQRSIGTRMDRYHAGRARRRSRELLTKSGVVAIIGGAAIGLLTVASRTGATAEQMRNPALTQTQAERQAQLRHIRQWKAKAEQHPYRTYVAKPYDTPWSVADKAYPKGNELAGNVVYSFSHDQGITGSNTTAGKTTFILKPDAAIGVLHVPRKTQG